MKQTIEVQHEVCRVNGRQHDFVDTNEQMKEGAGPGRKAVFAVHRCACGCEYAKQTGFSNE